MVLIGGLLLLEPDFGAFVVILAIAFGILFLGGLTGDCSSASHCCCRWHSPRSCRRAVSRAAADDFMDPWSDPLGKGYQLSHSLIAFGRGEWIGVGLGSSVEKLLYLPEAHTDFLLAVIAEELGFLGVTR